MLGRKRRMVTGRGVGRIAGEKSLSTSVVLQFGNCVYGRSKKQFRIGTSRENDKSMVTDGKEKDL